MANMTLALPDDLKQDMDSFPDVNWSATARAAFIKKIELLKVLREFSKDSELTDEDAIRIGRLVNKGLAKRYETATKRRTR